MKSRSRSSMKCICVVYTFRMNQHCQCSKYSIDLKHQICIKTKQYKLSDKTAYDYTEIF